MADTLVVCFTKLCKFIGKGKVCRKDALVITPNGCWNYESVLDNITIGHIGKDNYAQGS